MLRRFSNNVNMPEEEIREKLSRVKCWLLDMDGTITLGEEMIPGAERFFDNLKSAKYMFVTNNSSHGPAHYMERLERLGLDYSRDKILISTDALAENILGIFKKPRCYVLGTPDFEKELALAGIDIIKERDEDIDAVLLGFDTTLTYEKLDFACSYIRSGVPYYAANPDKVCPLKDGKVMPDCGAMISYFETCTSKKPERVFGKPDTAMIDMIMSKYGFSREQTAMVGDRIWTDIAFAKNAGIMGIAVLTGVTATEDIASGRLLPDFVFDNIGDISEYI